MVASVVDSIQQTLERLQVQATSESSDSTTAYTIIVQSSTASFGVRQALTEPVTQANLYQQAGLPTPAENAHLDWFGSSSWWQRVVQQLITAAASIGRAVVYLQTLPHHDSILSDKHVQVVNLSDNPWGWDDDKDNDEQETKGSSIGLNSLTDILDAVQTLVSHNDSPCNLVVDSLTPLWMRHGAIKVVSLIQRLQRIPQISTLLLHATDTLPAVLHSALEDEAHALLLLREGQAVWMHQGVRERDNMMRQVMKFTLQDGSIELVETSSLSSSNKPMVAATPDNAQQQEQEEAATRTTANATTTTRSGRPRLQLKLEEEEQKKTPAPTSGPRIFMQDDDPEFDDYDEEDPDDDLDI